MTKPAAPSIYIECGMVFLQLCRCDISVWGVWYFWKSSRILWYFCNLPHFLLSHLFHAYIRSMIYEPKIDCPTRPARRAAPYKRPQTCGGFADANIEFGLRGPCFYYVLQASRFGTICGVHDRVVMDRDSGTRGAMQGPGYIEGGIGLEASLFTSVETAFFLCEVSSVYTQACITQRSLFFLPPSQVSPSALQTSLAIPPTWLIGLLALCVPVLPLPKTKQLTLVLPFSSKIAFLSVWVHQPTASVSQTERAYVRTPALASPLRAASRSSVVPKSLHVGRGLFWTPLAND